MFTPLLFSPLMIAPPRRDMRRFEMRHLNIKRAALLRQMPVAADDLCAACFAMKMPRHDARLLPPRGHKTRYERSATAARGYVTLRLPRC
jgi:hypothetical protein